MNASNINKLARDSGSLAEDHDSQLATWQWRFAVLVVGASLLALLVLYWKTVALMAETWRSATYSYCFFLFPISFYLVWLRRERLALTMPRPNPRALFFLAALSLVWLLGALAEVVVVERLALVGMIVSLVLAELGTEIVSELRFPLAFLFFAVPIGDSVVPDLQDFTAWFAVRALDLVGVPVLLEGRTLTVGSGMYEVAQACSGLRFLTSSLAAGFLFAGLAFRTWKRRILFLLISAVVPILANALRVFGIVILGEYRGSASAAEADHLIYGWLFVFLVTACVLAIGWSLRESPAREVVPPQGDGANSFPARNRSSLTPIAQNMPLRGITVNALASLALLACAPIALFLFNESMPEETTFPAHFLAVTPPWIATVQTDAEWTPVFVGTFSDVQRVYVSGPRRVVLHLAGYSSRQGSKLAGSQNVLYLQPHWQRLNEDVAIRSVYGVPLQVRETVIRSGRSTRLLWSWYWVNGEFTNNDYRAKYLLAWSRLRRQKQGSAAIAVAADFTADRTEAEFVLQDFLEHSGLFVNSEQVP